jgi:putative PEP-CTERM system histidine kinase
MTILDYAQLLAFVLGLVSAVLIMVFRHFGKASWILSAFLIVASFSSGAQVLDFLQVDWTVEIKLRLSFCLLVAAAPLGALVGQTLGRDTYLKSGRSRLFAGLMMAAAPICVLWVLSFSTPSDWQLQDGEIALGPGGYASALYLILVSIFALASLEQTLRNAQERVRWEIKFLLLGMAGAFGAIIYIASKVLLFSPRVGLLSLASVRIFPLVFFFSCLLVLVSWKRTTGRWRVNVSPGVIYSSITLVSVGAYLIISALLARWAGRWDSQEISFEATLFILLLLALAIVLLWTDLRHRLKYWIRRHLIAGNYDYRLYWLEANERIRSIDSPEVAAEALADIVQKAVGAIDVSVWLRLQNPTRLKLVGTRGEVACSRGSEAVGIVEQLFDVDKPTPVDSLVEGLRDEPFAKFLAQTNASVLVPLLSSNRIVGLLTAGADRSGRPYDWDALEFLGVLANHAAGEFHKTDLLSTLVEAKESEVFRTFSTFLLHDLKNFASTLSLVAKNASRYLDNPDFQRDAFRSVFDTAEKMKKLCNSLRTFSGASPEKKLTNLNHVARAVVDNFSGDLSNGVIVDLQEIPPILIDAGEIDRVIRNLLLNAREAVPREGSITLRTRLHESEVELTVEDTGKGMSPEFIEKELFVPFHTTKSEGLGIGLYQSKKIVEAHQGKIRVESQEGHGTVIRLFFPLPKVDQAVGA